MYTEMQYDEFILKLNNSEKILVGIGKTVDISQYNKLIKLLEDKDYYIVSLAEDDTEFEKIEGLSKIVFPMTADSEEDWNNYTKWLQLTLNKNLLIIELDVGFEVPTVIRWPFEKIAMLNNKAYMYRINDKFYQMPEENNGKGIGVKSTVCDFLDSIERYGC